MQFNSNPLISCFLLTLPLSIYLFILVPFYPLTPFSFSHSLFLYLAVFLHHPSSFSASLTLSFSVGHSLWVLNREPLIPREYVALYWGKGGVAGEGGGIGPPQTPPDGVGGRWWSAVAAGITKTQTGARPTSPFHRGKTRRPETTHANRRPSPFRLSHLKTQQHSSVLIGVGGSKKKKQGKEKKTEGQRGRENLKQSLDGVVFGEICWV